MARGKKPAQQQKKKNANKQSQIKSNKAVQRLAKPTFNRLARRQPMIGMHTRALALSVVDPFNNSSCVPDGARGVSCFTLRQTFSLATGTTGTVYGIALSVSPGGWSYVDSSGTTNTATITGAWSAAPSNSGTIVSLYGKIRPVSGGLKVVYTGNTINDQGTIVLAQVSGDTPLSSFNGATLQNFAPNTQWYKEYPLRSGGQITWRPENMDDQMVWGNTSTSSIPTAAQFNQPYIVAWVFGAATSAASSVTVEAVFNYEGQFVSQSFIPGGQNLSLAAQPAEMGWYERSQNLISQVLPIVPYVASAIDIMSGNTVASEFTKKYGLVSRSIREL